MTTAQAAALQAALAPHSSRDGTYVHAPAEAVIEAVLSLSPPEAMPGEEEALLAALNAHRWQTSPLMSVEEMHRNYSDDMQRRWLDVERKKVRAVLALFERQK